MRSKKERSLDYSFSRRPFVRTLSYRDFFTSLSLALLLLALYQIIEYYSAEDWVGNDKKLIKITLLLFFIPFNHIIYKIEHKRPNNFIGRNLHDYIFLLSFLAFLKGYILLQGGNISIDFENTVSAIFILIVVIILIVMIELVIALLRRFLKLVKWQIL